MEANDQLRFLMFQVLDTN
uniref:Uncharacterized protein n=1 Tax=Arundo donax TaxID=35708 RepID=A0A0A9HPG0_ARUDO